MHHPFKLVTITHYSVFPYCCRSLASLYTMTTQFNIRSLLEANKLVGSNYTDWLRNLRLVLRSEKLEYILETDEIGRAHV